ncbi:TonB-dependent receptor [Actomonas aquatica]|uniref:TonB-dependent receptor n=1 Tax=Actomonas aquatica TaxID=2866162 RepID=A0ABZ1C7Y7_9BACT|nr:TonB-dependent receptor [Opitutus sp. WL0086]WRQ87442.1 TonB-dependent receptor [Opitutus sp. WL0086]
MKPSLRNPAFGSLLALATAATSAVAQIAPATPVQQLDELIVTADLWSSELARTSASATVFGPADLAANGTANFGDLINATPNLTWAAGTSRPRFFQIRGVGENSQFEGESPDSSVRFLIDDLDFTGLGSAATLFDAQQVEVLRGPQAGAFGANAAGGVIKIVTAEPTPHYTGYVETTVADDNHLSGGVAFGGPINSDEPDKAMFRLAAQRVTADGWRHNAFLNRDDTNRIDETFLRFKLRVNPTDAWRWDLTTFYAQQDNGYDEFTLDNTEFTTYSDQPGYDTQEAFAAALRGSYFGETFTFTTKTSFGLADSLYSYDSDWTDAADPRGYDLFLEFHRDRDTFNQELRLDGASADESSRWTVGAYYETLNEDTFLTEGFGDANTSYDATTAAVFGQWGQQLTDTTRLIAGLRVEDYDLETDVEFRGAFDFSDTLVGGKLVLEQDLGERTLGFASITRGYKAGGVNIYNYLVVPDEGPDTYVTEIMWNYELGLRTRSADGRFSGEVVAFYLDRDTPQVRDSAGFGGTFTYFVDNGESAYITGAEASFTALLADGFTAYGSVGLMDSHLDPFTLTNTAQSPAGGRELANVPSTTYSLGGRYDAGNGFWASAELNGRDSYYESNTHNETRSGFNVVNASIGYRTGPWAITLWARNLLDERYEKRIFYFANEGPDWLDKRYESPADPRQLGATVRYSF